MRISDWSSDVCSSDLELFRQVKDVEEALVHQQHGLVRRGDGDTLGDVGEDALDLRGALGERLLQAAFLVAQRDLRLLAPGDVGAHADEGAGTDVLLLHQVPAAVGPGALAADGAVGDALRDEFTAAQAGALPTPRAGYDNVGSSSP